MARRTQGVLRLETRFRNEFEVHRAEWAWHSTAAAVAGIIAALLALAMTVTKVHLGASIGAAVAVTACFAVWAQRASTPLLWIANSPFSGEADASIELPRRKSDDYRLVIVSGEEQRQVRITATYRRASITVVRFKLELEASAKLLLRDASGGIIASFDLRK